MSTQPIKNKNVDIVDKMSAMCGKIDSLIERLIQTEHERDFYKDNYTVLKSKLKLLAEEIGSQQPSTKYIGLTNDQMDVAKIAFPSLTSQEAYQKYANNVICLKQEGRLHV
jgi:hypothetical protein